MRAQTKVKHKNPLFSLHQFQPSASSHSLTLILLIQNPYFTKQYNPTASNKQNNISTIIITTQMKPETNIMHACLSKITATSEITAGKTGYAPAD